ARNEHHARVLARSALATGCRRFQEAHRPVPDHCRETPYPPAFCSFRFLLGPFASLKPAAPSHSWRSQFRLGAEPRLGSARQSEAIPAPESLHTKRDKSFCERCPHSWLGYVERARQQQHGQLRERRIEKQNGACARTFA